MQGKVKKTIEDLLQARKEYYQKIACEPNPKRRKLMKLPNLLTLIRPFSLFAILPFAFSGYFTVALGLTAISALTDLFDGIIARKFNAQSEYGKKLDPICDKIFAIGLTLPILPILPSLILPTIFLETTISSISVASEIRQNKPQSTKLGKAKTWALGFELAAFYLYQTLLSHNIVLPISIVYPFIVVANGMQVATSVQYGYLDQKKQKEKEEIPTVLEVDIEQKTVQPSSTRQEILEYQHLKETLLQQSDEKIEIEKTKTIGTL